jgi:thiamine-phosphate pyrophosphorylase
MLSIITSPEHIPEEARILQELLQAGVQRILLRKPGWQMQQYATLIEAIDPAYYQSMMISQYPDLCAQCGLGGVHFGEVAREALTPGQMEYFSRQQWVTSTSIHTPALLPVLGNNWHTLLLGPVFNSISKPGYNSRVRTDTPLDKTGCTAQVIALGGVDHSNIHLLRELHFDGAALLGAIWKDPSQAINNYQRLQQIWNLSAPTH